MKGIAILILVLLPLVGQATMDDPFVSADSIKRILQKEPPQPEEIELLCTILDHPNMHFQVIEKESLVYLMLAKLKEDERWGSKPWKRYKLFYDGLYYYFNGERDKSLESLKAYVELCDRDNMIYGMESPFSTIRVVLEDRYEDRLSYYTDKLEYYLENGPVENIAVCYHAIGGYYYMMGNYNQAIKYYLLAADKFKGWAQFAYNNELAVIGHCYLDWGNNEKALEYLNQAITFSKIRNHDPVLVYSLGAKIKILRQQERYEECIDLLQESLTIAKNANQTMFETTFNLDLAKTYLDLNLPERSLEYIVQAETLSDTFPVPLQGITQAFELDYTKYRYFQQVNDSTQAELAILKALEVAEASNAPVFTSKYLKELIKFYNKREDFKKSNQYALKYISISDTLSTANNEEAISGYEMEKLNFDKNLELSHSEQKRKTNFLIFVFTVILLIIILGGLYSRVTYIRKSRDIIQREKDRSDNLLLNILPKEIAEELKENGKAEARQFEKVSILFTDFIEFTKHSTKLSATDLVNEINHYFEAFDSIVDQYHIEKIKTIGDSYMAAGGLPVPTEASVKNTVLAALEMQAFVRKSSIKKEDSFSLPFEMRAGIHTGPAIAGIVGVKKFQYDVWGDTVNTASRIENQGAIGKVNISHTTYQFLKDDPDFKFESRGQIKAKGKGLVEMWFVERA